MPAHQLCVLQDEATVKDIAAEELSRVAKGWLWSAHARLLEPDLFESVPASDVLMRIHSTAEEFDPCAEELWSPYQVQTFALKV